MALNTTEHIYHSLVVKMQDRLEQPLHVLRLLLTAIADEVDVQPLFFSLSPIEMNALVEKASKRRNAFPDFHAFFSIKCRDASVLAVMQQLQHHPVIAEVYQDTHCSFPPAVITTTGEQYCPGYLQPAPLGINALHAWNQKGGSGRNISFIDIEQGWLVPPDWNIKTYNNTGWNLEAFQKHGGQVMAILLLPENERGGSGIVPEASGGIISQWRPDGTCNLADAIMTAISHLHDGDILLLEAQSKNDTASNRYWPVEIHPPVFEAIRLATALGITVIEAAGNGDTEGSSGNNLDDFIWNGKKVLHPGHEDFRDSGAVMVAAAGCRAPHERMYFSNYGMRIDCYAWGEKVNAFHNYQIGLNGTSSAAAIVAGAAISLQGIAFAHTNRKLSPEMLRALLRSQVYGTPSAAATEQIGVMPDLEKLVAQVLQTATLAPAEPQVCP